MKLSIGKFGLTSNDDYIYCKDSIEIKFVNNLSSLIEELNNMSETNKETKNIYEFLLDDNYNTNQNYFSNNSQITFFRGHSNSLYLLTSSIARENWRNYESEMYNELYFRNYDDFKDAKYNIDVLKKMQHYGLPTRLLDVTRSILTGMFFAVEKDFDFDGEIIIFQDKNYKYGNDNSVSVLAALPKLTHNEQSIVSKLSIEYKDKNLTSKDSDVIEKLISLIRIEKPGFMDKIKASYLIKPITVVTSQDSLRIVKQNAAFILCALNEFKEDNLNNNRISSVVL